MTPTQASPKDLSQVQTCMTLFQEIRTSLQRLESISPQGLETDCKAAKSHWDNIRWSVERLNQRVDVLQTDFENVRLLLNSYQEEDCEACQ